MTATNIINVTPQNVVQETLFCIKDLKKPGFQCKREWFEERYQEGLRMKILKDADGKMMGFIEYLPASHAWRPVDAKNYMFIHCMYISSNKNKNQGYGSLLIHESEKDAKAQNMSGVCVMTSNGVWITDKRIFEKNGFSQVDQRDRFELISKKWDHRATNAKLID